MADSVSILHRDPQLVVVDKPAGILSVPDRSSGERSVPELLARAGIEAIPVHRLDRDVSGALILALDEETRAALEQLFRERALKKTYWALAQGNVRPPQGAWQFPILEDGPIARVSALGLKSQTRYRTLEALPGSSVLEIDLVTGRKNQIRLHAAHAGFPLAGERKYARGKEATLRFKSRRVALHAWRLEFVHPRTGKMLQVEAPLPPDLQELLARARKG
jgi:23S rRNA pseudouridine1911/1915/1917 synthase